MPSTDLAQHEMAIVLIIITIVGVFLQHASIAIAQLV